MKGIIIPARSTSERFPRKHLGRLGETTVIGMLIDRALDVGGPVIVATTWDPADLDLVNEAESHGAIAWMGHPTDLNHRYLEACETLEIDRYLDISGDCPFFDQGQARRVWDAMDTEGYDTYGEVAAYAPNDTTVGGKAKSYLLKYRALLDNVSLERREQYWTAVEPPKLRKYAMPYNGDRTKTPIKISIDWPMDLAIANVILDVLGHPPDSWQDIQQVWSAVYKLRVG